MSPWQVTCATDTGQAFWKAVHHRRGARIDFRVIHDRDKPFWHAQIYNVDAEEWLPVGDDESTKVFLDSSAAMAYCERVALS